MADSDRQRRLEAAGKQLRSARLASGMTIDEVAQATAINRLRVGLIERGVWPPTRHEREALIEALRLSGVARAVVDSLPDPPPPPPVQSPVCTVIYTARRSGVVRRKHWSFYAMLPEGQTYFLEPLGIRAGWVQNVLANPGVVVQAGTRRYRGVGRVVACRVDDYDEIVDRLRLKYPHDGGLFADLTEDSVAVAVEGVGEDLFPQRGWEALPSDPT